jgi:hypothetical protein
MSLTKVTSEMTLGLSRLERGQAQTLNASQPALEFNIPSWAKKITVLLCNVSSASGAPLLIQLGNASTYTTSNYFASTALTLAGNQTYTLTSSSGLLLTTTMAGDTVVHGAATIASVSGGNTWVYTSNLAPSNVGAVYVGAGSITMLTDITRLKVSFLGSDIFDAGFVNVISEG